MQTSFPCVFSPGYVKKIIFLRKTRLGLRARQSEWGLTTRGRKLEKLSCFSFGEMNSRQAAYDWKGTFMIFRTPDSHILLLWEPYYTESTWYPKIVAVAPAIRIIFSPLGRREVSASFLKNFFPGSHIPSFSLYSFSYLKKRRRQKAIILLPSPL